jgi:starch synthase
LIAMRYGTLPLVMLTGGLADTVTDLSLPDGTGFIFTEFTDQAFLAAIQRVINVFQDKAAWQAGQTRAMNADFSWGSSAAAYERLYWSALQKIR